MYNSISLRESDQHMHRFFYRTDSKQPLDTYVITVVNIGDRPSGAIATVALRKTALLGADRYPKLSMNPHMLMILPVVSTIHRKHKKPPQIYQNYWNLGISISNNGEFLEKVMTKVSKRWEHCGIHCETPSHLKFT